MPTALFKTIKSPKYDFCIFIKPGGIDCRDLVFKTVKIFLTVETYFFETVVNFLIVETYFLKLLQISGFSKLTFWNCWYFIDRQNLFFETVVNFLIIETYFFEIVKNFWTV
jgi:hypothetical protein